MGLNEERRDPLPYGLRAVTDCVSGVVVLSFHKIHRSLGVIDFENPLEVNSFLSLRADPSTLPCKERVSMDRGRRAMPCANRFMEKKFQVKNQQMHKKKLNK